MAGYGLHSLFQSSAWLQHVAYVPHSFLPSLSSIVTPESCTRVLVRGDTLADSSCVRYVTVCMYVSFSPSFVQLGCLCTFPPHGQDRALHWSFSPKFFSSDVSYSPLFLDSDPSMVTRNEVHHEHSSRKLNTKSWFGAHCASLLQLVCHFQLKSAQDDRPGTCGRCCAVLVH